MDEFKKLPESYSNSGMIYSLFERNEKHAIYMHEGEGHFICEIFCVRVAKAATLNIGGKISEVPDRERVPGNEDFGKWAWCISGNKKEDLILRAKEIAKEIDDGIRPKKDEETE